MQVPGYAAGRTAATPSLSRALPGQLFAEHFTEHLVPGEQEAPLSRIAKRVPQSFEGTQMSYTGLVTRSHNGELSLTERSVSVVAGLLIAAAAARPRPNVALSIGALALGSFLAYRGATGYCPLSAAIASRGE